MAQLNNCPHCGSTTEFVTLGGGASKSVFARCTNCMIQTQPIGMALEYSAMDKIADVWNTANAGDEWPPWVRPTGGHDAYSKGSKTSHNGGNWISNVDANVWEPGVSGWTLQSGSGGIKYT